MRINQLLRRARREERGKREGGREGGVKKGKRYIFVGVEGKYGKLGLLDT